MDALKVLERIWDHPAGKTIVGLAVFAFGFQPNWGFLPTLHLAIRVAFEAIGMIISIFGIGGVSKPSSNTGWAFFYISQLTVISVLGMGIWLTISSNP